MGKRVGLHGLATAIHETSGLAKGIDKMNQINGNGILVFFCLEHFLGLQFSCCAAGAQVIVTSRSISLVCILADFFCGSLPRFLVGLFFVSIFLVLWYILIGSSFGLTPFSPNVRLYGVSDHEN